MKQVNNNMNMFNMGQILTKESDISLAFTRPPWRLFWVLGYLSKAVQYECCWGNIQPDQKCYGRVVYTVSVVSRDLSSLSLVLVQK